MLKQLFQSLTGKIIVGGVAVTAALSGVGVGAMRLTSSPGPASNSGASAKPAAAGPGARTPAGTTTAEQHTGCAALVSPQPAVRAPGSPAQPVASRPALMP